MVCNQTAVMLAKLRLLHVTGSHDNVVALRGISRREENLVLVTEYCPKGTLHLLLHGTAQNELDAFKMTGWVRAIARGMLHLHNRKPPILHRDLKPANIFVGKNVVAITHVSNTETQQVEA